MNVNNAFVLDYKLHIRDVTIHNKNSGSLDIFSMCRRREIRIEFHELQIKI